MKEKKKKVVTVIKEADYYDAVNSSMGWCTSCLKFTRECTEPDAMKYDCPICKQLTVMGAEQALLLGLIVF